jgi:hypothetical protein
MTRSRIRSRDRRKETKSLRGDRKDPDEQARSPIYGVASIDPRTLRDHPANALAKIPEDWHHIFNQAVQFVTKFLAAHDPFEIVAKTSCQVLATLHVKKEYISRGDVKTAVSLSPSELAEVELVHTLALMQTAPRKRIPAAPSNMERFFTELPKLAYGFSGMQQTRYPAGDERAQLIRKVRLQTIYQRNSFIKSDCEAVVPALLRRFDDVAERETGFRFSQMFRALLALSEQIHHRQESFFEHWRLAREAETEAEVISHVEFYCGISETVRRAWSLAEKHCRSLSTLKWAAFQLSELCNSWIFTLQKPMLRKEFGDHTLEFFERIAYKPGDLANTNVEYLLLDNPIWHRPLVSLDDDTFFLPTPSLIYSFPLEIFEPFMPPKSDLGRAYAQARSSCLETAIEENISSAMPSARTYRRVIWDEPESGNTYENDVVAIIGNTIFLFEAKSGRLDEVARRGGELSLIRNFKELFVEPGIQAARLERYLNKTGQSAELRLKDTGESISLDLEHPKIVHKFSICIEHFASLTSAKNNLKLLGAIEDNSAWAPVLSIAELLLLWRYLDSEISFYHYLTRRATLENLVDFEGDEHDILATYLVNGLCLDPQTIQGRKIVFLEMDHAVKEDREPRADRTEFCVYGVPLTRYWKMVAEEVYDRKDQRHRFDIIECILNQDPHALANTDSCGHKWRNGLGGKNNDVILSCYTIGKRAFVLGYYLSKHPLNNEEWKVRSRTVARKVGATDCVMLLRCKKSSHQTFDGISFFRLLPVPTEPV